MSESEKRLRALLEEFTDGAGRTTIALYLLDALLSEHTAELVALRGEQDAIAKSRDTIRAEVLEEAACIADAEANEWRGDSMNPSASMICSRALEVASRAIRARATVPPPKSLGTMLREFHARIGQSGPSVPTPPGEELSRLRARLEDEEHGERALERPLWDDDDQSWAGWNGEQFARWCHEQADVIVVAAGSLVASGVDPDAVVREVMRANMTKVPGEDGGKAKKPDNWDEVKPDVAKVLREQGWKP